MKLFAFVLSFSLLGLAAACSSETKSQVTINPERVSILCVRGVSYLLWSHGISVMFDQQSKVIPCQ